MPDAALISIIDDDQGVRDALAALLRSAGYAVDAFASGSDFLGSDALSKTQCAITDVMMPEMNGFELQERLVSAGHRFPIIFLSATTDAGARTRALQGGAHAYLTKPYLAESLIACVALALAARGKCIEL